MSDPVNLAGVVGTWVAVFLAIVALAGVLPAYLLYQKSKTERAQALALIDDPTHTFVSRGLRLPGVRINQTIKVPDLLNPPRLQALVALPELGQLGSRTSTTGWISFAHVMMATFSGIRLSIRNNALVFQDGKSYLPVHRDWIIVLGVLHRYAFRPDYGLPLGAMPDADIIARDSTHCLSGLSGILSLEPSARCVGFEMHTIPHLQQSLSQETIHIRTLVLLFLGYIQMPNGEYLTTSNPGRPYRSRVQRQGGRHTFMERLMIVKIVKGNVAREHIPLFLELDLVMLKINNLITIHPDEEFGRPLPWNLDANMMEEKGFFRVGEWKERYSARADVWILKVDIHRIVFGYLDMQLSPKGILYDAANDMIVQNVFKTEDLVKTLNSAKKWASKLNVNDDERQELRAALDAVMESDTAEVSWGRHAMQTFCTLDRVLSAICKTENWRLKAISVLYVCDEQFRTHLSTSMERIEGDEHQVIKFDIQNKLIKVPDWEQLSITHDFNLDFQHTFANTRPPTNFVGGEMSFAQVALASLQGHLRAIMWKCH